MKIRIKFAKRGSLKFVGHLDTMRYFQKLIRRAGIDIAYSEGFNPHQKLSFAQPLGVGMLSEGEYVDIEVNSTFSSREAIKRMNDANVDDLEILSYRRLSDNAGNAMASVAAADYMIELREGKRPVSFDFLREFTLFINSSDKITVLKETKKSQIETDIKPYIYKFGGDNEKLTIRLSCGSVTNIKPELVMEAFCKYINFEPPPFTFIYTRLEVYGINDRDGYIPLEAFGDDII